MRVLTVTATETGRRLARRLPYPHAHGEPARVIADQWAQVDAFVVVLAVGATVRLIAPHLSDKAHDPAVVSVDDAGCFAVVVTGGHGRQGNRLAAEVSGILGAEPVVTTATDRLGVLAFDQLPGLVASGAPGAVAAATSAVLAGSGVELENPLGWPLPEVLVRAAGGPASGVGARAVVTDRAQGADAPGAAPGPPMVLLHPPSLVVGVGTSSDATAADVMATVDAALSRHGLARASVAEVATVDRRAEHPAVVALATASGGPLRTFDPATLATVTVPTPSERVRSIVGTPSVAEAAALTAAGPGAALVAPKLTTRRVSVAVARRAGPRGSVSVVGLGPGHPSHRTLAATTAIRHADVVIGYRGYLEQCADLLAPGQQVLPSPLGAEVARARTALEAAAAGHRVALVCSGDPGIYAMASPLVELVGARGADGAPAFAGIDVTIVPGVTASLAASAALGAPLGHDHAAVSLSDLLTPWEVIEARVRAAAAADFVLTVYNPRSAHRTWQLEKVKALLLEHRSPTTPVGLVRDATRPDERVILTTLGKLPCDEVTMVTCVVVGSSTTRAHDGRMVTPRGYAR